MRGGMQPAFDVELRGRLGPEPGDVGEIKILNRILRLTDAGVRYEADPRHVELLSTALGLQDCREVATPGVKQCSDDEVADGKPCHEDEARSEVQKLIQSLHVQLSRRKIKFHPQDGAVEIPPYSEQYGLHPREFVTTGRVGQAKLHMLTPECDPYTGVNRAGAERAVRELWSPKVQGRAVRLRQVLVNGAEWEVPTTKMIAAMCKKPPTKKVRTKARGLQGSHTS